MPLVQEYTIPLSLNDPDRSVYFRLLDDPAETVNFPKELPGLGSLKITFQLQDSLTFDGGGTYEVYGKPDESADVKVLLASTTVSNGATEVSFDIPADAILNEWSAATTNEYPVIIQVELKEGTINVTRKARVKIIDSNGVGTGQAITSNATSVIYTPSVTLDWQWADETPGNNGSALDSIAKEINNNPNKGSIIAIQDTPPVSPADGDKYITGPAATGDWSSNANEFTRYFNGAWYFRAPVAGDFFYDESDDLYKRYDGSNFVGKNDKTGLIDATGSAYTLLNSHSGSVVEVDDNVTIPVLTQGKKFSLFNSDASAVTLTASGTTFVGHGALTSLSSDGVIHLIYLSSTLVLIKGDLE